MGVGAGGIGYFVNVEEHSTGNTLGQIFGMGVARDIGQVPGGIHDHDVGRFQVRIKPFG